MEVEEERESGSGGGNLEVMVEAEENNPRSNMPRAPLGIGRTWQDEEMGSGSEDTEEEEASRGNGEENGGELGTRQGLDAVRAEVILDRCGDGDDGGELWCGYTAVRRCKRHHWSLHPWSHSLLYLDGADLKMKQDEYFRNNSMVIFDMLIR